MNSIPFEAKLKVDLRSESDDEITRLESAFRECMATGVRDEMENARDRTKGKLEWRVNVIGSRPGGALAPDSALLASLRAADDLTGNQSRIERSSTDANIPLSMGIDAISIGAGGNGGGAHSLQEWYEPAGRENGLKRVLRRCWESQAWLRSPGNDDGERSAVGRAHWMELLALSASWRRRNIPSIRPSTTFMAAFIQMIRSTPGPPPWRFATKKFFASARSRTSCWTAGAHRQRRKPFN